MFFNLLFLILGMTLGSFIGALSFRYPRGISIVKGRSFCPNCKHTIAWYDNIPVLSYLILGGKCRNCKKRISIRYPLIELSTGVWFFVIYFYRYLLPFNYLFLLFIFCLLIFIIVTDIEYRIIPDEATFLGIISIFFYSIIFGRGNIFSMIFSGLILASILMFIHLVTRGRGMGLGDVKFAVMGGMLLDLKLGFIWFFLSFLTGGTAGIILVLTRAARLKDQIAFGPFLIVGIFLTYIFGESISKFIFLK